jgi:hypothetical protein
MSSFSWRVAQGFRWAGRWRADGREGSGSDHSANNDAECINMCKIVRYWIIRGFHGRAAESLTSSVRAHCGGLTCESGLVESRIATLSALATISRSVTPWSGEIGHLAKPSDNISMSGTAQSIFIRLLYAAFLSSLITLPTQLKQHFEITVVLY